MKPRALLALAALVLACGSSGDGLPEGRRHVLLITVDTLRWDYLSAAGYDRPTSPFIDTLLAQGLVFRRALTPVPRTTPALASLLTGTYPHTHEVRRLLDELGPRLPTLASLARAQGARTVAVVSNHLLGAERGLARGFDVYDSAPDVRDAAATTRAALDRLDAYSPSDDLLVWVHYIDPHVPYSPPPEYAEAFDPGYEGRYRLHFGSAGGTGDFAYPSDLGKERSVFRNQLPAEVNAHVRRLYAGDIRHTDDAIRTLVEALRERFGADWTIVFAADHGEDLGEKPFFYFDHGDYLYDGSLRIPLAVVLPPFDPLHRADVVDDWASLVDVTPTLIELLGLQRDDPTALEGRSLVPALRGEPLPPRALFAESGMSFYQQWVQRRVDFGVRGRFRAVVRGNWKLIFTPGRPGGDGAFELYDLANDPGEQRDRFRPDHPSLPELARELEAWLRQTKHAQHAPDEADLALLRALGSRGP